MNDGEILQIVEENTRLREQRDKLREWIKDNYNWTLNPGEAKKGADLLIETMDVGFFE